jgi:biopolymer transport protein ExbB
VYRSAVNVHDLWAPTAVSACPAQRPVIKLAAHVKKTCSKQSASVMIVVTFSRNMGAFKKMNKERCWFLTIALVLVSSAVFAQEQAVAEAVRAGVGSMTFKEFYTQGGGLMHVISALSVLCLANILYLFVSLRAGVTVPRAVFNDIIDKVRGGQFDDARKVCDYKPSPFSSVATAALDYIKAVPDADPILLSTAMEGEGTRQVSKIQGRTQWLLDIAAIAPMVGLLGTVVGMLGAFRAVGSTVASAKPVMLAEGVSLAIITTIAGLMVAIPAMAFYAWFRRIAMKQAGRLETAASELLTAIISQRTE